MNKDFKALTIYNKPITKKERLELENQKLKSEIEQSLKDEFSLSQEMDKVHQSKPNLKDAWRDSQEYIDGKWYRMAYHESPLGFYKECEDKFSFLYQELLKARWERGQKAIIIENNQAEIDKLTLVENQLELSRIELEKSKKSNSLEQKPEYFNNQQLIAITTQQQREQVLNALLNELQTKQPSLNLQLLPFNRSDMLKMLADKSELFEGLSDSQFDKFFKAQKLCKLRRGRPIK